MTPDGERLARLEVEVKHLTAAAERTERHVEAIRDTLSEARGGWKTLAIVAGVSSVLGGFVAKVLPFLPFK